MRKGKSVLVVEYISGGGIENVEEFNFLIPEGFGMLSALITDFIRFGFTVHTFLDSRLISRFDDTFIKCIGNSSISYTEISKNSNLSKTLLEIIPKFDYIMIIAPEFNHILYNLIRRVEENLDSNQILLNLSSAAILIFSDKLLTESYLSSLGFETPFSEKLSLISFTSVTPNKEYIVKPIDGVGASDTYCFRLHAEKLKLNSIISWISHHSPDQEFLIQQKIDGIPLSAFIVSNCGEITYFTINYQSIQFSEFVDYPCIQKLEYLGGFTPYTKISSIMKSTIQSIARIICSQFHITGCMGIDFLYNPNLEQYHIIDVNPRVTTPYIAISALFHENDHNILECFFAQQEFREEITGTKSFMKTNQNTISLK